MAEYEELHGLFADTDLAPKVNVAVVIAATDLLDAPTPTPADRAWASSVLGDPRTEGKKALMYILAKNKDATVTQILSADKGTIQTEVDAVVPQLVSAYAGA